MMKTKKVQLPLSLATTGELALHFIGTGSAFTKKNYQNNLIVMKKDTHLVIDFGTKASQGLYDKGVKVADIKAYLITHTHADHIGSMEEVALIGRYFTKSKPDLIIPKHLKKPLWDESLKGGLAFNENPKLEMDDLFNVIHPKKVQKSERPLYEMEYKGIDLKIFKTNHIPGDAPTWREAEWASGVLIDEKILFTADTKFDEELLTTFDQQYDLELIIHDCQFFPGGVHASYDQLKTLPEKMRKKTLLTHYADNWEQFTPENDGFLGFAKPDLLYTF